MAGDTGKRQGSRHGAQNEERSGGCYLLPPGQRQQPPPRSPDSRLPSLLSLTLTAAGVSSETGLTCSEPAWLLTALW